MLIRKADEENAQHSCLCSNWTLAPEQTQLFTCIAIISTAGLVLCEPLPYTAHRVQVLLCKGIIPKHRSLYVTQKKDLSYQLLLGRQRLPALWDCIYKQSSLRQQVIDFITESLQDKITVFIMMWWYEGGKKDKSSGKLTLGSIEAEALCCFRDTVVRLFSCQPSEVLLNSTTQAQSNKQRTWELWCLQESSTATSETSGELIPS